LSYTGNAIGQDITYTPYGQVGTRAFLNDTISLGLVWRHHFMDDEAEIFVTEPGLDGNMVLLMFGFSL
jgi:hypothetical protein